MADENQEGKESESQFSRQQYEMLLRCSQKRDMSEWNKWRKENSGADVLLEGADLEGAYLKGASLWRANLRYAQLVVANLQGVQLVEADMQGAKLAGVNLQGAELVEAKLRGAELVGANLEGTRFWNADLRGAAFTNATFDGGTLVWKCRVDRATNFEGVGLECIRIDPQTRVLLEYNVRRANWQHWYRIHPGLAWLARPFWCVSDYGRSTGRIILSFLTAAVVFAIMYRLWPGLISVRGVVGDLKGFWQALYFSVITMTTLGLGDIAANPDSWWGQTFLMLQVILGCAFLGALVTRFTILLRAGGPAGRFADEKSYKACFMDGSKKVWGVIRKISVHVWNYLRDVMSRRSTKAKREAKPAGGVRPRPKTGWVGDLLQTGDVIHVQARGPASRLCRWFSRTCLGSKTWASHSAMVLRDGERVEIIEALHKASVRPIGAYARRRSALLICRKPGGLDADQKQKIIEKAEDYRGRKYGFVRALAHRLDRFFSNRYIFRRLARMDDYPISSWLVAYVYDRVLGCQFGAPPNAVRPDHLLDNCVEAGWDFVWADSAESVEDFCRAYELAAVDSNVGAASDVSENATEESPGE